MMEEILKVKSRCVASSERYIFEKTGVDKIVVRTWDAADGGMELSIGHHVVADSLTNSENDFFIFESRFDDYLRILLRQVSNEV